MRRIYLRPDSVSDTYRIEREDNKGVVHYDGVGVISTMTLCGYVDIIGADWIDTTKRVNCAGCLAVRKHVMGC